MPMHAKGWLARFVVGRRGARPEAAQRRRLKVSAQRARTKAVQLVAGGKRLLDAEPPCVALADSQASTARPETGVATAPVAVSRARTPYPVPVPVPPLPLPMSPLPLTAPTPTTTPTTTTPTTPMPMPRDAGADAATVVQ